MEALYLSETVDAEIGGLPDRTKLGKLFHAGAVKMALRILSDEWEIPNAEQAAKIMKLMFDAGRVQDGLPTSISAPADKAAIKKLVQEARERGEKAE